MALRLVQATLFFLLLNILTENRTGGTTIRTKCECVTVKNFVRWRYITNFTVRMPEPICNRVQIILQMKSESLCLDPSSKQGKRLQQCWRDKSNKKRVRACLAPKKVKQKGKPAEQ